MIRWSLKRTKLCKKLFETTVKQAKPVVFCYITLQALKVNSKDFVASFQEQSNIINPSVNLNSATFGNKFGSKLSQANKILSKALSKKNISTSNNNLPTSSSRNKNPKSQINPTPGNKEGLSSFTDRKEDYLGLFKGKNLSTSRYNDPSNSNSNTTANYKTHNKGYTYNKNLNNDSTEFYTRNIQNTYYEVKI